MKLFYKQLNSSLALEKLVNEYSYKEFKSPYRSTVNMLSLMQSPAFDLFLKDIGVDKLKAKFHCEYCVPVQDGTGPASQTDLMIFSENRIIAIEAKNTEDPYDKVTEWIDTKSKTNKTKVLNGWLKLINSRAGTNIKIEDVNDITYQMIHRLASACIDSTRIPEMIYLYFGESKRMSEYYNEQLKLLNDTINDKIKISFLCIKGIPTDEMKSLFNRWDNGERDLRNEVIYGLTNNSLYTF